MKPNCADCPVISNLLFREASSGEPSSLECIFRPTRLHRNHVLYLEGSSAQHLFGLRSGLVKLVNLLENGKERIVRVLFPGAIFGFEALTKTPYPVTAVVLQDSEICVVPCDEFFSLLHSSTDTALGVIRYLVGEVTRVRSQIAEMSFKDARMRVATFVLSLVPPAELESSETVAVTLPFSSLEIGEILELSPETVSRTWGVLRRDGLVQKRGRKLIIQDLEKMRDVAHR
ncbi:MAG TPA: Crp/Fnr family transcriptional regulator [Terriglobia bacterium]|nr:Crp/Fnr family transcriptional regulator [Terriglobia bacterium]